MATSLTTSFNNIYHHRKVAETSSKSCDVCFKPTTSVLITPDNKDFFYICPSHLENRDFCSPIVDKAEEEARKKKEMNDEVGKLKEEYDAKQKKKEAEAKKDKDEKDSKDPKDKEDEKDKDKSRDKTHDKEPSPNEPRVFALRRTFYDQRVKKKRQAEMARKNRQRLQDPSYFPSVPSGRLGQ